MGGESGYAGAHNGTPQDVEETPSSRANDGPCEPRLGTPVRHSTTLLLRVLLGTLFLITGIDRATHPWPLVHQLDRLDLLPAVLTHALGFGLPWLEVMVGVYLLLGLFTRLTAGVAVVLLAFFAFSLGVWIARGETQGCSCTMGTSNNPIANVFLGGTSIGVPDVLRDGALVLAALALVALGSGCLAVDNVLRHASGHAGVDQ